jgi:hypothetical protein
MVPSRTTFLKKMGSGMHRVTQHSVREGGVSYIDSGKKRFWNAILACSLLVKNLWNGIPASSVIKIPMVLRVNSDYFLKQH